MGGANGAQVRPKTEPNRRQKRRRKKKFFKIVLVRSWSRLGTILEPSWPNLRPSCDDLGSPGGAFSLIFYWFLYDFRESTFWHVNCRFGGSWSDLGACWGDLERLLGPSWPDLGAQEGPKGSPRRAQNGSKTTSFFDAIFDATTRRHTHTRTHAHTFKIRVRIGLPQKGVGGARPQGGTP